MQAADACPDFPLLTEIVPRNILHNDKFQGAERRDFTAPARCGLSEACHV